MDLRRFSLADVNVIDRLSNYLSDPDEDETLGVEVAADPQDLSRGIDFAGNVNKVLKPHLHRFRALGLFYRGWSDAFVGGGMLPHLETLHTELPIDADYPEPFDLTRTPNLCRLAVPALAPCERIYEYPVGIPVLRHLTISLAAMDATYLFDTFSELVELTLADISKNTLQHLPVANPFHLLTQLHWQYAYADPSSEISSDDVAVIPEGWITPHRALRVTASRKEVLTVCLKQFSESMRKSGDFSANWELHLHCTRHAVEGRSLASDSTDCTHWDEISISSATTKSSLTLTLRNPGPYNNMLSILDNILEAYQCSVLKARQSVLEQVLVQTYDNRLAVTKWMKRLKRLSIDFDGNYPVPHEHACVLVVPESCKREFSYEPGISQDTAREWVEGRIAFGTRIKYVHRVEPA